MPAAGSVFLQSADQAITDFPLTDRNYVFFALQKREIFQAGHILLLPEDPLLSNYIRNVSIHTYGHSQAAVLHIACQNDAHTGYPFQTDIRSPFPSRGMNGYICSVTDYLYIPHRLLPSSCDAGDRSWKFRYHLPCLSDRSYHLSYTLSQAHRSYLLSATGYVCHKTPLPSSNQKDFQAYEQS